MAIPWANVAIIVRKKLTYLNKSYVKILYKRCSSAYLLENENGHEEYSTVNFHSMDCRTEDEHDGGSGEEGTEGGTRRDALGVVDPGGELDGPQDDEEASLEVADDVEDGGDLGQISVLVVIPQQEADCHPASIGQQQDGSCGVHHSGQNSACFVVNIQLKDA